MIKSPPLAPAAERPRVRIARPLARRLARGALASAWALRHPREPLAKRSERTPTEARWVSTEDGWELPLRRIVPRPGARGEPVVLATELGPGDHTLDALPDQSLARLLHQAGYDVWWFHHRGTPRARPPARIEHCDMDAVASFDIPAALERIRAVSGAERVLWIGHGIGAQVAMIHLALGGDRIAGLVSLTAAVCFPHSHTRARIAGRVAAWLPPEWRIPIGTVADVLAPGPGEHVIAPLTRSSDSLERRSLLLHGVEAVRMGLIRQGAMWFEQGHLSDRSGTVDYTVALRHQRTPMFVISASGDLLCPPEAVAPLVEGAQHCESLVLDRTWG
ncbi:MAG TPA: hypothetical protein DFR83_20200, partial [Deltaproteobacteria bacterium]|nr:hypothetical protein [Deltaproteobacteria bacterium]